MSEQQVREVTLTRVFNAPREMVFRGFTDPALLAQWWAPDGYSVPLCEIDPRPGGQFRVHMMGPDGVEEPGGGEYREVVPPERVVFTSTAFFDAAGVPALEVLNTVTFKDLGGKTEMNYHSHVLRAEPAALQGLSWMEAGLSQGFDKLGLAVAGEAPQTEIRTSTSQDGTIRFDIDEDRREITITRDFDAPRELVFQVMTDPALIPQWWGPAYLTTTVDQMDLRPGGAWRFVQRAPDGAEHRFRGVYLDITPPERLIYTFEYEPMAGHEQIEAVTFIDQGDRTRVVTKDTFKSLEDLRWMFESGMESGLVEAYERVDRLLQTVRQGR